MKTKLEGCLFVALALVLAASISALPQKSVAPATHGSKGPLKLIGVIPLPGNPLMSSDIAYMDEGTKRFYLAGRSNFGIDIVDAETDLYVGRIAGWHGINTAPMPPNIQGPNGVLVTPGKKLWAGDGDSILRVADVDPKSPDYLKLIQTVSTAIPGCAPRCNRVDELGYDPEDHIIAAVNHDIQAASAAALPAGTQSPDRFDPYVTFVNADTYKVLGSIPFENATGLEQPMWEPGAHRFFLSVGGYRVAPPAGAPPPAAGGRGGRGAESPGGQLAVINPKTLKVEKKYDLGTCHPSGEVVGPMDHVLVACGGNGSYMVDGLTGKVLAMVTEFGGGDENWYNPGDGNFYFTGPDKSTPPVNSIGVVDGRTGKWLQNVPD